MSNRRKLKPSEDPRNHIKLRVISAAEAEGRSVLQVQGEMKGDSAPNTVWDCGACGGEIAHGIAVNQIQGIVMVCKTCGAFNESLA